MQRWLTSKGSPSCETSARSKRSFSGLTRAGSPGGGAVPGYPNLTANDQMSATLFVNFTGSIIAGSGASSNSRNNDFTPIQEDHAQAFDGGPSKPSTTIGALPRGRTPRVS